MMEAAEVDNGSVVGDGEPTIREHSLAPWPEGSAPATGSALTEVIPPLNFVRAIEKREPDLLDAFECRAVRRAFVTMNDSGRLLKLIEIDDKPRELYDLVIDPREIQNIAEQAPQQVDELSAALKQAKQSIGGQREAYATGEEVAVEADPRLVSRLRGLGYLD